MSVAVQSVNTNMADDIPSEGIVCALCNKHNNRFTKNVPLVCFFIIY